MKNKFIKLLVLIISVSAIFVLTVYLLDMKDRINEGKFRINDFIITSKINVEEITTKAEGEKLEKLSDFKLNISQTNKISILVAKLEEIKIDNIKINVKKIDFPAKYEKFNIYQNTENILDCKNNTILDVSYKEESEQSLIEFSIDNLNLLKEVEIPQDINSITYDGTILKTFGITLNDILFKVELELIITDANGKQNVCNINLELPEQLLIDEGISYIREDLKMLNFKVK